MKFLARLLPILALCQGLDALGQGLPGRMRDEARRLVASFDARAREALVLPFASEKRTDWHYVPRSRPGLSFADMDAAQREAVHALLRTALSAAGHRKVVNIIELEVVLREIETLGFTRDPQKYSIVFFGEPHERTPWAWRFEGHHLSLSFTLRGSAIATTPSFLGANPARVPRGPRQGLRVLAAEEDEGRALLLMLDEGQRRTAIIDSRPYGDIVTRAADRVSPLENRGLEARAMTAAQRAHLKKLIGVYADNFESPLRAARLARSEEGFDAIRFAWAGATEPGRPHYYRVQGPKFLIEMDASQDGGNHIHSVWRDFDGDFGRDLLREHHARHRH
jgi:hypothetical protein